MALYRPLRAGVMGVLGFFLVTLGGCFPPSDTSVLTWGSPPQLSWQGVGPAGSYSPVYTTSIAFDPTGNLLCAVQEYTGGISW
ncbi:MAG TPA: hypothetical protein VL359_20800, partial [bacterium]|nr:hypothetical protein [bacterium]